MSFMQNYLYTGNMTYVAPFADVAHGAETRSPNSADSGIYLDAVSVLAYKLGNDMFIQQYLVSIIFIVNLCTNTMLNCLGQTNSQ